MKVFGRNVGRRDARSREVTAVLLVAGGVTALAAMHGHALLGLDTRDDPRVPPAADPHLVGH